VSVIGRRHLQANVVREGNIFHCLGINLNFVENISTLISTHKANLRYNVAVTVSSRFPFYTPSISLKSDFSRV